MDIIIIGSGIAGLAAAIKAAENQDNITIIASFPPVRSQSIMATGGINAALDTKGEHDSWTEHFNDTMKAGGYLADEVAVAEMCKKAPELIRHLAQAGVVFSRDEKGNPDVRNFGGQSKKRTVYAKAGIGRQLVEGLSAVVRYYQAEGKIKLITNTRFIKCITIDGRYAGVVCENTDDGSLNFYHSDILIAASGGMGGLFAEHTGSCASDGSLTASLLASGVEMANLEMIQYHPTTVKVGNKRMLISEAARGEGGRLFTMKDGKRYYFMEDWHGEKGNLMPRDIVSKSIYQICDIMKLGLNNQQQVGLDLTQLSEDTLFNKLKEVSDATKLYLHLDPSKQVIPVYPGVHYFMGGISTDSFHHTLIAGIYAAGECACIYHGANRLGGNSLLGAVYGGIKAANSGHDDALINDDKRIQQASRLADSYIKTLTTKMEQQSDADTINYLALQSMLQDIIEKHLGIMRSEATLKQGLQQLKLLQDKHPVLLKRHISDAIACENFKLLGEAILKSACFRQETRGAHIRTDYPKTDDDHFKKTITSFYENGEIKIRSDEIGRLFK